MGSDAGAWDGVVWDDHPLKFQVQEGPGLRGSHAGYTDSGGAHARNQGVKIVGARRCLTESGTWRRCRVRRLDVLRAAGCSGIEVELEEAFAVGSSFQ
jgi:hypothetical protein